jgi:hypothetical protein
MSEPLLSESELKGLSRTPLKCLLSRSIKGKELITYQNLVSEDYAQKSGKSRTIANKFGMYWYVTSANEIPRLRAEHLPGPERELSFRNQEDYISKYRRVLEHFDAAKIGLTATPALHTVSIFGDPVFKYSYRDLP